MPQNSDQPAWVHEKRRRLGRRIQALREHADLRQQVFAEMTGIDRRTLQRIEAGTSDPPYSSLVLIASALGISVSDLVGE